MLAVKGRYNGATVVLESKPPISECEVVVNFPEIPKADHKQENGLKQILKYRGQDIWEGDMEGSVTQSLIGAVPHPDITLDEIRSLRLQKYDSPN